LGQQTSLASLYLQSEVLGVDAALGQTAGDKPEARLRGAREHVAQFLAIAESPDWTNAGRDIISKQFAIHIDEMSALEKRTSAPE
jgi:hypothetical protein